jgi:hypothetical protein
MTPKDTCLHVLIADIEAQRIRFPFTDLLRAYGIDPTKPYTQRDHPGRQMHEFIQERQYTLLPPVHP